MKTIFKYCAAAVLVISAANAAFAADTAELKVQGKLIMGSCTPSLPSDGVVDYGTMSVSSLSPTTVNQLGMKEVTLTMNCTSPTKVSWTMVDDRADSVIDTQPEIDGNVVAPTSEFGLGKTAGGVPLGSFGIIVENNGSAIVDGSSGVVSSSHDNGTTWAVTSTSGEYAHPNGDRIFTFSDAQANPVPVTVASDVLAIGASLQNTTTLAITDDTPLDGQATISVKYL